MSELLADLSLYLIAMAAVAPILLHWLLENHMHRRQLRRIPIRVHVNGVRGKSTVVRYIASALRAGGYNVLAKTTGSATRIIRPDGSESDVVRRGAPTILEQVSLIRKHATADLDAIVFECMAVRPDYQRVAEHKIMHSTLGVLLNVRRDHPEQLGYTLPEIAASLSETMAEGRDLLTSETNPVALEVLREEARGRGANLVELDPESVTSEEMKPLGPFAFRENVVAALAVAQACEVDRGTALHGMAEARDDPGASRAFLIEREGYRLHWVDLFGINDPESAEENILKFLDWLDEQPALYLVLNNRADREDRARDFADWILETHRLDGIIIIGDLQEIIRERLANRGYDSSRIHSITADDDRTAQQVLEVTDAEGSGRPLALFGLANIHTESASALRQHLQEIGAPVGAEAAAG